MRNSLWGLSDTQSWRAVGQPLLFDAQFNAKPAFHAIVDTVNNFTGASLLSPVIAVQPVPGTERVAVRPHMEALGATVSWNPATQTTTVTFNGVSADFTIGVNAELIEFRTVVPFGELQRVFDLWVIREYY